MSRRIVQAEKQLRRRVLGVDLGLKCGCSAIDVGGGLPPTLVMSGTWYFGNVRNMGGGMAFLKFNQEFSTLVRKIRPDAVAYEIVRFMHSGSAAAQVYYGMESQLVTICEIEQLPFEGFGPGQIKKHGAGHGHASKEMVKKVVGDLFGDVVDDDNEADARATALTLARTMGWDDGSSAAR